ncbi:Lrp/AsnC family transcriptional regulator [Akkermansiaceae bacterium]|nr:Lrp/AsnC family transcriptional regulator [Akkermansiaceae bacterium]
MTENPIIDLLRSNARYSTADLAALCSMSESDVADKLAALEKDGTILGYQTVINTEKLGDQGVSAFIEVKLTPERDGGFDKLAMRIAKFSQVNSCYLASGGYDLMVVIEGQTLRDVASFVTQKLSTIEGVVSTATHFRLKTYKENGLVFATETSEGRLVVSP